MAMRLHVHVRVLVHPLLVTLFFETVSKRESWNFLDDVNLGPSTVRGYLVVHAPVAKGLRLLTHAIPVLFLYHSLGAWRQHISFDFNP